MDLWRGDKGQETKSDGPREFLCRRALLGESATTQRKHVLG